MTGRFEPLRRALTPIRDQNSKPAAQQMWERIHWGARLMATPNDYRRHQLYLRGKTHKDALRYLSGPLGSGPLHGLNPDLELLEDKLQFEDHFGGKGLPVPTTVAVIGIPDGHRPILHGQGEVAGFLRSALAQDQQLVIKPLDALQGRGVVVIERISGDDLVLSHGQRQPVDELSSAVSTGGRWLIQKRISQHGTLAALNPSSLNTVRLGTFRHQDGLVDIQFALLRVGRADSQIDTSDNGFSVRVDCASGRLSARGYTKQGNSAPPWDTRHCDSGAVFGECTVPFWNEIIELGTQFAHHAGRNRFVGWDVAVTPDGPVFVEGNGNWGMASPQLDTSGILTDEFIVKLREEAGIEFDIDHLPPLRPIEAVRGLRRHDDGV